MKLKAAVTNGVSDRVLSSLNSPALVKSVFEKVLVPYLKVSPAMGPAEFYAQECDLMIPRDLTKGCEVRLTGVSKNRRRADEDFFEALSALEEVYAEVLSRALLTDYKIQLFVVIMLDAPVKDRSGQLVTQLETDPKWIEGKA